MAQSEETLVPIKFQAQQASLHPTESNTTSLESKADFCHVLETNVQETAVYYRKSV